MLEEERLWLLAIAERRVLVSPPPQGEGDREAVEGAAATRISRAQPRAGVDPVSPMSFSFNGSSSGAETTSRSARSSAMSSAPRALILACRSGGSPRSMV